jgi:hypothetical protein
MTNLAIKALEEEASVVARTGSRSRGLVGLLRGAAPEVRGGGPFQYTLRLPHDAGTFQKVLHYGAQPMLLGKAVMDTKENIDALRAIAPKKLIASGFTPEEAATVYQKTKGRVFGRAAGDAASWALYPLSIANPALHFPVVLGGSIGAPILGETIGRNLST